MSIDEIDRLSKFVFMYLGEFERVYCGGIIGRGV